MLKTYFLCCFLYANEQSDWVGVTCTGVMIMHTILQNLLCYSMAAAKLETGYETDNGHIHLQHTHTGTHKHFLYFVCAKNIEY